MKRAKVKIRERSWNKTERDFAERLKMCQKSGLIAWWSFEPWRLRLGKGAWYTPDFIVLENDGCLICYETKGFWREAARVRIKVAADRYPFLRFVAARLVKGEWEFEEIG